MRVSFFTMLIVSLVLHGLVAVGIAFSLYHRAQPPGTEPVKIARTSVMFLHSLEPIPPKLPPPAPVTVIRASIAPAKEPTMPPAHSPLVVTKPAGAPIVQVVMEKNPNAHRPAPAPEAILAPVPPPILDGAKGVVFMLDISGSMYEPFAGSTRLALSRQVLAQRIRALKDGTPFAIVLYAQTARASGPLVAAGPATREAAVRFIQRDFDCGGGTNLPEGLEIAANLRTGAILLVSDGDLNSTAQNLSTRAKDILGGEKKGPVLEVIGIAPRQEKSAEQLLQLLADQHGGSYTAASSDGEVSVISAANPAAR